MVSTALMTLIYLSFISLGLPDSMLGSAWPAMTVSLNAPLWGAGLIQMLISFCTIISSLNSARLIRKFGTGRLTAISVATTALALLGFSLAKNYVFLLLMAVPLGLGARVHRARAQAHWHRRQRKPPEARRKRIAQQCAGRHCHTYQRYTAGAEAVQHPVRRKAGHHRAARHDH